MSDGFLMLRVKLLVVDTIQVCYITRVKIMATGEPKLNENPADW